MANEIVLLTILRTVNSYTRIQGFDRTWASAEDYCVNTCGSNLASIHSLEDWNAVLATGTDINNKDIWIGLEDPLGNNQWQWSDGTPWDYGNTLPQPDNVVPWKADQPNNLAEECVIIFGGARLWGDTGCNQLKPFICNGACGNPTEEPTTATPTTFNPTTNNPTTSTPTTIIPTTIVPTTTTPTTINPTTIAPNTMVPTTTTPTTLAPTTREPTKIPSHVPSVSPNKNPTLNPSIHPSKYPTKTPTASPERNGEIGPETTADSRNNNNGQGAIAGENNGLDMYGIMVIVIVVLLVILCCIVFFFWRKHNKQKQKRDGMDEYNNNDTTELGRVKSMSSDGEQELNNEIDIEEVQPNVLFETNTNMVIDAVNAEPDVYSDQSAVKMWLENIGLVQYYKLFMERGLSEMNTLLSLTENDLENMGINKMAHRKRIVLQIADNKNRLVKQVDSGVGGEQYNGNDDNTMMGPGLGNDTPMGDMQDNANESDGVNDLDQELYSKPDKVTDGNIEEIDNDDNENLLSENEDEDENEMEDSDDIDNQLYQKPDKITDK